jgi:hypothetical protein
MNDSPRKGGVTDDTTGLSADPWQGRWHRPVGVPGRAVSSSSHLSHAIAKCVTLPAILVVEGSYSQVFRDTPAGRTTRRRGGLFFSGCGYRQHPNGGTECRMGESPAGPEAPPGTQGAQRPSSFRPGRERSEVPVRECDLLACGESAEIVVTHPFRPESWTALCAYHADRALDLPGVSA